MTIGAYIVKKRGWETLIVLTFTPFDGMTLNNVHYSVEVGDSARLNAVRWTVAGKIERTANQAYLTD